MTAKLPHESREPKEPPHSTTTSLVKKLWRYFLSGVLVTAPLALTIYIVWAVIKAIDTTSKKFIPTQYLLEQYVPFDIPGTGIITAFIFFTLVGFLAAGVMGRLLVSTGESLLERMPLVRNLYKAVKQIFEAVFQRDQHSFREVVLFEYPRRGIWALGFVTGVTKGEVQRDTEDEVVNVFLPTTPNPTSGFLLFIPRSNIRTLTMTVEEGIKMVMSGGIVTPPYTPEAPDTVSQT